MKKFGILTLLGSTQTVPLLQELRKLDLLPAAVIIDGRLGAKAEEFIAARLDRSYVLEDLPDIDLTDVPSYFVSNNNAQPCLDLIAALKLEFLVSAGTRILKAPILNATDGVINCHPAILPAYRGCTTVEWSLYNGDPVGATAHFMSEKIDEGPIILSETMTVAKFEPYEIVRTRMIAHQARVQARAISRILKEGGTRSTLPPQGSGKYYKPIPLEKILELKTKLAQGGYSCP